MYQFLIVGAGAIGCAIATRLSTLGRTLVVESLDRPGQVTSRRNSGVIHSGIHLPPQSQKARFARLGSTMVKEFCQTHAVPYRQVGMHIVVAPEDVFGLWAESTRAMRMIQRAKQQSIPVTIVTGRTVRKHEPAVRCLFGLHLPAVAIIDPEYFTGRLRDVAFDRGAEFRFNETVTAVTQQTDRIMVTTSHGIYATKRLINAAGLYADRIAGLAGFDYHHYFYRGEYYEVDQAASGLHLNGLVYPVHQPGKPGLGVHLTPTIDGRFLLGPNARRVEQPTDYEINPTPPEDFWNDVRSFLPGLQPEHLHWAYSGIRCKLTDSAAENDFIIRREKSYPPIVNCIGIESPGLTSALAIARHVETLLTQPAL